MRFPAHGFLFYESGKTNQESRKPGKDISHSRTFLRSCLPNPSLPGFLASRFLSLFMIAPKDSIEPQASDAPLPNSKKLYVPGSLHPDLRVPLREISLAPTKTISGEIEVNEPVRVYDTSGPWGDAAVATTLNVENGLPPLRTEWIRARGDVEEIEGRAIAPADNGYLSEEHARYAERRNGSSKSQAPSPP